jgi:hypothetical protein
MTDKRAVRLALLVSLGTVAAAMALVVILVAVVGTP